MSERKKWSKTEDDILLAEIKASPTNLKAAFKAASSQMNRTEGACSNRWYTFLSKDKNNACFITVSGKHQSLNRKNGKGTHCTPSLFKRVLHLLGITK